MNKVFGLERSWEDSMNSRMEVVDGKRMIDDHPIECMMGTMRNPRGRDDNLRVHLGLSACLASVNTRILTCATRSGVQFHHVISCGRVQLHAEPERKEKTFEI